MGRASHVDGHENPGQPTPPALWQPADPVHSGLLAPAVNQAQSNLRARALHALIDRPHRAQGSAVAVPSTAKSSTKRSKGGSSRARPRVLWRLVADAPRSAGRERVCKIRVPMGRARCSEKPRHALQEGAGPDAQRQDTSCGRRQTAAAGATARASAQPSAAPPNGSSLAQPHEPDPTRVTSRCVALSWRQVSSRTVESCCRRTGKRPRASLSAKRATRLRQVQCQRQWGQSSDAALRPRWRSAGDKAPKATG